MNAPIKLTAPEREALEEASMIHDFDWPYGRTILNRLVAKGLFIERHGLYRMTEAGRKLRASLVSERTGV